VAKINTISKFCSEHNVITIHNIYNYGKKDIIRCSLCSKEQTKKRRTNPLNKAKDAAYTKTYIKNNKEKYIQLQSKYNNQRNKSRKLNTISFFTTHTHTINYLLEKYKFPLSYKKLVKWSNTHQIYNLSKIEKKIISTLYYNILKATMWKESTIVKYHHGVRETYHTLPESQKILIRKEYTANAKTITLKQLNKIKSNLITH